MLTDRDIEKIIDTMDIDDMIGQMMCFHISKRTPEEMEELIKKTKCGSFFVSNTTKENISLAIELMNKYTKVPGIISADVEKGPGHVIKGEVNLPHEMAWGSADDADLVERAHIAVAERCRELGIHWNFSPIVDISYNPNNPASNIRLVSDVPSQVAKMGVAAVKGLQRNGLMIAGCKHFPGAGLDDRDSHFVTAINYFSREKWMETYGMVYKEMFKAGTNSIMIGHEALPAFDEESDKWLGGLPATFSYNILTKLLREELGFEGCVVSDGICMIGAAATMPYDRLAIEYVKAGGDVILFPNNEYIDEIKGAVASGEISVERIKQSVRRIIRMKDNARLFEDQKEVEKDILHEESLVELADAIADKSIKLVRNYNDIVPAKLNKGDKILIVNLRHSRDPETAHYVNDLDDIQPELEKRGYVVSSYVNPSRHEEQYQKDLSEAALVLVNCKISSQDYPRNTLKASWEHIDTFWRGDILRHPKVVFTSFGDPYKLYEFTYLKTYINAFSYSASTQRAFVKTLLGEIPFQGKNPVSLKGFFEAEV